MSFADHVYLPFLALVVGITPFVAARLRPAFLLAASGAFYAWYRLDHALLLGASIFAGWATGRAIGAARTPRARTAWLAAIVVFDVGLLIVFKYGGFLARTASALVPGAFDWPALALPLGISFYTFQGLGYAIDVRRRRVEVCDSLVDYALYISFFPQLVAGPIERAGHLLPQLRRIAPLTAQNASMGGRRILWGLLKKWVVADRLRAFLWPVFTQPEEHGAATLLLTTVGLNALLYLDFSAYTDIGLGSARLFGVTLIENFNRPFLSRSLGEYAQRWHASLYTWIRDYAFEPLMRGPLTHASIWRNNLLVMGLFGLWHGASWTLILWGLAAGVVIAAQHSWRLHRVRSGIRRGPPGRAPALLGWLATGLASSLFFVLFFSPDLEHAGAFYRRMLSFAPGSRAELVAIVLPLAGILAALFAVHAAGARVDLGRIWVRIGTAGRALWFCGGAAALVLLRVPDPLPFIYFAF